MSMRPRWVHSQHRTILALQLQPMTRQQLEACLQLHRTTVTAALDALEGRGQVKRTIIGSRAYGAWPEMWSIAGTKH